MKKILFLTVLITLTLTGFSQTAGDFYKRATVKFKAGDYAGAAVEYTRAIDLSKSSAVLYSNRGVCYFRIEQ
jgi:Flp pilus assembly protein TadD